MSAGLFGGKKEERPPPVDRVSSMMQTGLSEREIIRQLKAEGYGFSDIEKAMLTALKQGVTAPPIPAAAPARPEYMPAPQPPMPIQVQPAQYPEWPQPAYAPPPSYEEAVPMELPPLEAPSSEETPEDIMEDILEGLTEEKFEKFSGEIKKVRDEFEKIRAELRAAVQKPAVTEAAVPKEVIDKMDNIEARVGGLEKAFRQFLPTLTQNIEELAKMIHEMRQKEKGAL